MAEEGEVIRILKRLTISKVRIYNILYICNIFAAGVGHTRIEYLSQEITASLMKMMW